MSFWQRGSSSSLIRGAFALIAFFPALASAEPELGAPDLVPPVPLEQSAAEYPAEALARREAGDVLLAVTIDAGGKVSAVEVLHSAGTALDDAASRAVRRWSFAPARKDGVQIASRVRVPFVFRLPLAATSTASATRTSSVGATTSPPPTTGAGTPPLTPSDTHGGAPPAAAEGASESTPAVAEGASETISAAAEGASESTPASPDSLAESRTASAAPQIDVFVRSHRRPPPRGASDFVIEGRVLHAAPHRDSSELLMTAPGLFVSRSEGDAVAPQISLRGFDAEHGQDLELKVAGVPVNQRSHLHGQGYADLSFVPPEVVRSLHVREGVYDPRQGDFATAGSIELELGVLERGIRTTVGYGSFATRRLSLLYAPENEGSESFGIFTYQDSDGYGTNRGAQAATLLSQYGFRLGRFEGRVHFGLYGARANSAGVLRRDDLARGRVGFYDAYPDPTARAQSALSSRLQLGVSLERKGSNGARSAFSLYAIRTGFRQRGNFTGYVQRSRVEPSWTGRGDLIEQQNDAVTAGMSGAHRASAFHFGEAVRGFFEVGAAGQLDRIEQAQNLLQAPQNETWDQRVDARITGANVSGFVDLDLHLTRYVNLHGGLRADTLFFDVDDRLGNRAPRFRREDYILGYRRTALGLALGPRVALTVDPLPTLSLFGAYGEGYRSPQARQLEEGESAPYAKVRSGEVGARYRLQNSVGEELLNLTGAAFYTRLSLDLAFDPVEGRLERIGPSTRQGLALVASALPLPWLTAQFSATYVRATLDAPPPPSAENPSPPYRPGQRLPYVSPFVTRSDLAARLPLGRVLGTMLVGRLGLGLGTLAARPLPFGRFSPPVVLLDGSAGLSAGPFELNLDLYNVFDRNYAANEYVFVSNWEPGEVASRLPARHIAAGPPRTLFMTLSFRL